MAITKCSFLVPLVNRFTVRRDVLRQCGRTSNDAGLDGWRKIMSKTNDTSRELTNDELNAVSGGMLFLTAQEENKQQSDALKAFQHLIQLVQ
jgi:bacteriocin-like protein